MNIYIMIGLFTAGLVIGWRAEVWHQAYSTQNTEEKAIVNLGKGASNIIDFNANFDKVKSNVKSNCLSEPVPDDIRLLLH